jgi:hypothetical protein
VSLWRPVSAAFFLMAVGLVWALSPEPAQAASAPQLTLTEHCEPYGFTVTGRSFPPDAWVAGSAQWDGSGGATALQTDGSGNLGPISVSTSSEIALVTVTVWPDGDGSQAGPSLVATLPFPCTVPDVTAPVCRFSRLTAAGFEVHLQDSGVGLAEVSVAVSENASAMFNDGGFTVGFEEPVVAAVTRSDPEVRSRLVLVAVDTAGNTTTCSFMLTTLAGGGRSTQTISEVPDHSRFVTIRNNAPGLRRVAVTVNETRYVRRLQDGEERTIDATASLDSGEQNRVVLRGSGHPDASAEIVIWGSTEPAVK